MSCQFCIVSCFETLWWQLIVLLSMCDCVNFYLFFVQFIVVCIVCIFTIKTEFDWATDYVSVWQILWCILYSQPYEINYSTYYVFFSFIFLRSKFVNNNLKWYLMWLPSPDLWQIIIVPTYYRRRSILQSSSYSTIFCYRQQSTDNYCSEHFLFSISVATMRR